MFTSNGRNRKRTVTTIIFVTTVLAPKGRLKLKPITYYHVTTEDAAAKIMDSGKLGREGNAWESRVFVWSEQPTKGQAKAVGIGSRTQTVLKFNTNASFEPDAGIINPSIKNITLQSTDTQRIPINIQNVESVEFRPRWWEFWKK